MAEESLSSLAVPLLVKDTNLARHTVENDDCADASGINAIVSSGLATNAEPAIVHPQPLRVQLYNPADVAARIAEMFSDMPGPVAGDYSPYGDTSASSGKDELLMAGVAPDVGDIARPRDTSSLSHEETHRYRKLLRLARDPAMGKRDALIGNAVRLDAVNALRTIAPHFGSVITIIADAVAVSARTGTPLAVPPICLLGPPGIGKTFFARQLAAALDTLLSSVPDEFIGLIQSDCWSFDRLERGKAW